MPRIRRHEADTVPQNDKAMVSKSKPRQNHANSIPTLKGTRRALVPKREYEKARKLRRKSSNRIDYRNKKLYYDEGEYHTHRSCCHGKLLNLCIILGSRI